METRFKRRKQWAMENHLSDIHKDVFGILWNKLSLCDCYMLRDAYGFGVVSSAKDALVCAIESRYSSVAQYLIPHVLAENYDAKGNQKIVTLAMDYNLPNVVLALAQAKFYLPYNTMIRCIDYGWFECFLYLWKRHRTRFTWACYLWNFEANLNFAEWLCTLSPKEKGHLLLARECEIDYLELVRIAIRDDRFDIIVMMRKYQVVDDSAVFCMVYQQFYPGKHLIELYWKRILDCGLDPLPYCRLYKDAKFVDGILKVNGN